MVITKLNLASQPFRNRTVPYLLALLLLACAVAGFVISFAKLNDINKQNELARSDISQMDAELQQLNGKGAEIRQQLSPADQELLVAAHKLVANKTFGWSRLFADLESLLPGSVSVSRISVENIYKDGDKTRAELDFGVLSRDYQSVMTMIGNMNGSGVFQAELRGQDLQKTDRLTYTEYTLHLIYSPPNSYAPAAPTDVAQTNGGNQ